MHEALEKLRTIAAAEPFAQNLSWHELGAAALPDVLALTAECALVDGGLLTDASDDFVRQHFLPSRPGAAIGARKDGRLIACAAVQPIPAEDLRRMVLSGQVHPDVRRQGIGSLLLLWSSYAAALRAAPNSTDPHYELVIRSEALDESAGRLYARHGFQSVFAEEVMRHPLQGVLPAAAFPPGVSVTSWQPDNQDDFFQAYRAAFKDRPGFPDWSREKWVHWVSADDDFRPELSLLASCDGLPVGFVTCSDRFVIQVGVRPEWRKRGLGAALVRASLKGFQAAGERYVLLDVNVNNPAAQGLFKALGFVRIGRRGQFSRVLKAQEFQTR